MYEINSYSDYESAYRSSVENPEKFWGKIAETFEWRKKWDKVLNWDFEEPNIEWFVNGKLNITENKFLKSKLSRIFNSIILQNNIC